MTMCAGDDCESPPLMTAERLAAYGWTSEEIALVESPLCASCHFGMRMEFARLVSP